MDEMNEVVNDLATFIGLSFKNIKSRSFVNEDCSSCCSKQDQAGFSSNVTSQRLKTKIFVGEVWMCIKDAPGSDNQKVFQIPNLFFCFAQNFLFDFRQNCNTCRSPALFGHAISLVFVFQNVFL